MFQRRCRRLMWRPLVSLVGFALVATACGSSDDPSSTPPTHIDGPLVAGTNIELSLVMTKFGGNAVTIGYEVILEP